MDWPFTPHDNSSDDGFNVKKPKALMLSPKKKFTALVAKDFDLDHDHYDLYGCTKQPALHGQSVGLSLKELLPYIDSYADGYVGCMECDNSREEVPVPIASAVSLTTAANEVIRNFAIYEASDARLNVMSGMFSSEVIDRMREIRDHGFPLYPEPTPPISVASLRRYTPISPMYSPIIRDP